MATSPQANPLLNLSPSQVNRADTAQWRQLLKQAAVDTRCATPAFLVEDLGADQTVSVQVAIQERARLSTGVEWLDIPVIRMVPVILPRGGGYSVTLPLKKGDEGLLIFCDTCFDFWWANGQQNSPPPTYPPGAPVSGSQRQNEVRRHHLHDCGFWPGMWSQPNLLTAYSTSSLQIRRDDATVLVDVSGSGVAITGPAVTAQASGGTPQALMNDTFYQWYVTNIQPFLVSKGYAGPGVPTGSETTVLKGQ